MKLNHSRGQNQYGVLEQRPSSLADQTLIDQNPPASLPTRSPSAPSFPTQKIPLQGIGRDGIRHGSLALPSTKDTGDLSLTPDHDNSMVGYEDSSIASYSPSSQTLSSYQEMQRSSSNDRHSITSLRQSRSSSICSQATITESGICSVTM